MSSRLHAHPGGGQVKPVNFSFWQPLEEHFYFFAVVIA
jgi:hypothetical protein